MAASLETLELVGPAGHLHVHLCPYVVVLRFSDLPLGAEGGLLALIMALPGEFPCFLHILSD